jgi:hypothetical protein
LSTGLLRECRFGYSFGEIAGILPRGRKKLQIVSVGSNSVGEMGPLVLADSS